MSPLPDADKKSPRVYTLTQNTDLENLAFATMQSIGQPISIEEMSEDELRRLVLVNLARLSVKGEWDGLLTSSSGGGGIELVGDEVADPTNYKYWNVASTPPYGVSRVTTGAKMDQKGVFFPFIASQSGALTGMRMRVQTAHTGGNFYAGVYSADENTALPKTLQGYATFSTTSTGTITALSASFSSSITTTRGTLYWIYCNVDNATTATNVVFYGQNALNNGPSSTGGPYDTVVTTEGGHGLRYDSASTGTPGASVTTSDLESNSIFTGTSTGYWPTIYLAWT